MEVDVSTLAEPCNIVCKKGKPMKPINNWPEASEYIDELLKEQKHGSDRALVLVAVTMVDDLLQRLLHLSMIEDADKNELFSGDGAPLGAFSKKIKVAYSLGLLTKIEKECCDTLRRMRNEMAHTLGANLSSASMQSRTKSIYEKAYNKSPDLSADVRNNFIVASQSMIIALLSRLQNVKHAEMPTTGFGLYQKISA